TLLLRLDLRYELPDVFFFGDVAGDWDDLSRDALAMSLDDPLELLFGSANNVDFGSVPRAMLTWRAFHEDILHTAYTARAWVAMSPMPLPAPVTKATLPRTLKTLELMASQSVSNIKKLKLSYSWSWK